MEGQLPERRGPTDPQDLRISDDDRHKVSELLRQAAGEGRIDIEELDERLEATYQAKTYGDLVPITVDLPTAGGQRQPAPRAAAHVPAAPAAEYPSSIAVMSETKRQGSWLVEDGHTAFALMGAVRLDLREATFSAGEIVINAHALMGEVTVVVDSGTTVVVEGTGVMGEYNEQRAKVDFDPERSRGVVRVRGFALMGAVHVQRKPRRGEQRRRLGWSGR